MSAPRSGASPSPRDRADAEPAPRIEGYQVTRFISAGGMGTVWDAVQLSTNRRVAIKFLGGRSFASPRARQRFAYEVELAARLEHPHIARVYDSGVNEGAYFYAMEFIDGIHLDEFIRTRKLDSRQTLELFATICDAVQHAHQRGVIHRDLKPTNVLVTPDGQPHVLDFGLAKAIVGEGSNPGLTLEGERAGTPAFMSPEQAAGEVERLDTRTDVYSLGVMLYRALVGRPPHDLSGSNAQIMDRIARGEARRPRQVNKSLDRELETLLLKSLSHDPDARYASAGDLARDIRNYLTGQPLVARAPTATYVIGRYVRRYRARLALAASVLLAFLILAALAVRRINNAKNDALTAYGVANTQRTLAQANEANARTSAYISGIRLADQYFNQSRVYDADFVLSQLIPSRGQSDLRGFEWYYLRRLVDGAGLIKLDQKSPVQCLAVSPDGRRLAVGTRIMNSGDRALVKLWNLPSAQLDGEFPIDGSDVLSLSFSPDSATLLASTSTTYDPTDDNSPGTALLWDLSHPSNPPRKLSAPARLVWIGFSKDSHPIGLSAGPTGGELRDLDKNRTVLPLGANLGRPATATLSTDARRLAVGFNTSEIIVYDLVTSTKDSFLSSELSGITTLAFSPDGASLAIGLMNGPVKIRDLAAHRYSATLRAHESPVWSLAFSPDGRQLATAGADNTVRLWDVSERSQIILKGHKAQVHAVAFAPSSPTLISGDSDDQVILFQSFENSNADLTLSHNEAVLATAFSTDGRRLFAAGGNYPVPELPSGELRQWDPRSGALLRNFQLRPPTVDAMALSPKTHILAAATSNGPAGNRHALRLWDLGQSPPKDLGIFATGSGAIYSLAFSTDGRFLAAAGGMSSRPEGPGILRLWDLQAKRELPIPRVHEKCLSTVAFSPDGKYLATGSFDRTVAVRDLDTDQITKTFTLARTIVCLAFSPDGSSLAAGIGEPSAPAAPSEIHWWDWPAGSERPPLRTAGIPFALTYSPDSQTVAAAIGDGSALLFDAKTGAPRRTLLDNGPWAVALAFSPDSHTLAVGAGGLTGGDGIHLHHLDSPASKPIRLAEPGFLSSLIFIDDARTLASATAEGALHLWDPAKPTAQATLLDPAPSSNPGHTRTINTLAVSSDSKHFATAGVDKTILLWTTDFSAPTILKGHTAPIRSAAFSPDGKLLATGSAGTTTAPAPGELILWDVSTTKPLHTFKAPQSGVPALAFSRDGQTLVEISDSRIVVRPSSDWTKPLNRPMPELSSPTCLALSPDAKTLLIGNPARAQLWSLDTGRPLTDLTGNSQAIYAVAFSPDGRTAATAGEDRTVRLYHVPTGQPLVILTGHHGKIFSLAFSPDNKSLASAGERELAGELKLWRAAD